MFIGKIKKLNKSFRVYIFAVVLFLPAISLANNTTDSPLDIQVLIDLSYTQNKAQRENLLKSLIKHIPDNSKVQIRTYGSTVKKLKLPKVVDINWRKKVFENIKNLPSSSKNGNIDAALTKVIQCWGSGTHNGKRKLIIFSNGNINHEKAPQEIKFARKLILKDQLPKLKNLNAQINVFTPTDLNDSKLIKPMVNETNGVFKVVRTKEDLSWSIYLALDKQSASFNVNDLLVKKQQPALAMKSKENPQIVAQHKKNIVPEEIKMSADFPKFQLLSGEILNYEVKIINNPGTNKPKKSLSLDIVHKYQNKILLNKKLDNIESSTQVYLDTDILQPGKHTISLNLNDGSKLVKNINQELIVKPNGIEVKSIEPGVNNQQKIQFIPDDKTTISQYKKVTVKVNNAVNNNVVNFWTKAEAKKVTIKLDDEENAQAYKINAVIPLLLNSKRTAIIHMPNITVMNLPSKFSMTDKNQPESESGIPENFKQNPSKSNKNYLLSELQKDLQEDVQENKQNNIGINSEENPDIKKSIANTAKDNKNVDLAKEKLVKNEIKTKIKQEKITEERAKEEKNINYAALIYNEKYLLGINSILFLAGFWGYRKWKKNSKKALDKIKSELK